MPMRRRNRLSDDVGMDLAHVRFIAADGGEIPALLPSLGARENFWWK